MHVIKICLQVEPLNSISSLLNKITHNRTIRIKDSHNKTTADTEKVIKLILLTLLNDFIYSTGIKYQCTLVTTNCTGHQYRRL